MPFGGLGTLAALSAAPKVIAGVSQAIKANKVRLQDNTPAAFREKMALDRQAASSGQLPGLGMQQNRLGMVQAGALQNARLGAASGSDFLAAAGAADARRQAGEMQLGVQGQQYNDRARSVLGADLTQQAAYQQQARDNYNREKAALTQASAENLNAAVSTATSYGAAGINRADNLSEAAANRAAGVVPTATAPGLGVGMGGSMLGALGTRATPAAGLTGLYGADPSAYDLSALPDAPTLPGLTGPVKPRRVGLGPARARAGLYGL